MGNMKKQGGMQDGRQVALVALPRRVRVQTASRNYWVYSAAFWCWATTCCDVGWVATSKMAFT
jgi:hypothetical protein